MWKVFSACILMSFSAFAADPVAYSRGELVLLPTSAPQGVLVGIDVRDTGTVFEPGWFEFAGFADGRGLLLTNNPPTDMVIKNQPYYAKLDIVFFDIYGAVMGILPNQSLAELSEDVAMEGAVQATLFLKGGTADSIGLKPGDKALYKLFRQKPIIRTKENTPPPPKPLTPEEKEKREKDLVKRHYEQ